MTIIHESIIWLYNSKIIIWLYNSQIIIWLHNSQIIIRLYYSQIIIWLYNLQIIIWLYNSQIIIWLYNLQSVHVQCPMSTQYLINIYNLLNSPVKPFNITHLGSVVFDFVNTEVAYALIRVYTIINCYLHIQGDQLNIAACFWYLVKSNLSSLNVYISVHWTLDKSLFTKYQKNTAMFNWSPCIKIRIITIDITIARLLSYVLVSPHISAYLRENAKLMGGG